MVVFGLVVASRVGPTKQDVKWLAHVGFHCQRPKTQNTINESMFGEEQRAIFFSAPGCFADALPIVAATTNALAA